MSASVSIIISVRDGARFKNKPMGVMVYFYPAKKEKKIYITNQVPLGREIQHDTWIHDVTIRQCIYYCIYLNSSLLEAPREYILHGLVPGLN